MGGKDEDEEDYAALIYREYAVLRPAEAAAAAAKSTKKKKKKAKTAKKKKKLYWSDGFITSYVKQRTSPPK